MIPRYDVEYAIPFRLREERVHREASDLTACTAVVAEMFESGFSVRGISCGGERLPKPEVDKILRRAAELLVQRHRQNIAHS